MKIVWLEDEPETIEVIKYRLEEYCREPIVVCQSFLRFSTAIKKLADENRTVIIIDIRMICNREIEFNCFDNRVKIYNELDSGFEYFNNCLKGRFEKVTIVFFSSKPRAEAMEDAKRHQIDPNTIISKDSTTDLIDIIKEIK